MATGNCVMDSDIKQKITTSHFYEIESCRSGEKQHLQPSTTLSKTIKNIFPLLRLSQ